MPHRSKTRADIIHEAAIFFAAKGFYATSLNEIAEKVGIRGPAVYKHFSNKEEIYEAVLDSLFRPIEDELGIIQHAPAQTIKEKLFDQITFHLMNPNLAKIILHANLSGGPCLEVLNKRVEQYSELVFSHLTSSSENQIWATKARLSTLSSLLIGYIALVPSHQSLFKHPPLDGEMLLHLLETFRAILDLHPAAQPVYGH